MRENTNIRHKLSSGEYCTETLFKEYWGNDEFRMTCVKCGFVETIHNNVFLKWQYCDEVISTCNYEK